MAREKKSGRPSKTKKAEPIGGLRPLSAALASHGVQRSHTQLGKITGRDDWPFPRPWMSDQLPAMARWIQTNLQEDRSKAAEDADDVGNEIDPGVDQWDIDAHVRGGKLQTATSVARISLAISKKAALELDRLIKEGKYVSREKAESDTAAKFRAVKTALQQIPQRLAQLLADTTDPGKCRDILNTALRSVCDEGFEGGR